MSSQAAAALSTTNAASIFKVKNSININFASVKLNYGDYVAMFLTPPVYDLQATVMPYNLSETYDLHLISNYTQLNSAGSSLVVMIPSGPGTYNLSVTFISKAPFVLQYGIVTQNYTAYPHLAGEPVVLATGVWFLPIVTESYQSNYTAYTFTTSVTELSDAKPVPSVFSFKFPSVVSLTIFLVISALLIYVDAFVVSDTYWKEKSQEASRKRWIGVILLVAFTLLIIYWSMGLLGVKFT
ncbi:hypothetical protein [Tardisphaera saccharovorans]